MTANPLLRILILEDLPSDAAVMERELRHAGLEFVARCVENAQGFVVALDEFKPDLVLSDYEVLSFSGMAALRVVQQRAPMVPFIIVAGSIDEGTATEFIKAGAADYVPKDRLVRLPTAVRGALQRRSLAQEKLRVEQALRDSEEKVRRAQKMEAMGQLAGGVAHDFNDLLQAMLNLTQVLLAHRTDPERVAADVAELEQQVKHGAALTRQLMLFSRRETAQPEALDLNEVVREAGKLLRRLLKASITIEQRLAEGKLPVVADRGQIEQVLFNLAVNAADAMLEGGQLVITTGSDVSTVWLQLADTGGGIPEGIRQRIFEPFFTTKGEGGGTGLGLAVVHGIVAQHGGSIAFESNEGQGTTFTITLPRGGSGGFAAVKVTELAGEAPAGHGERVLIVEDEASARDSLAEILTVLGYEVVAVESGEEAGLLPPEPAFKVLLTDIMLPGIAGADLARGLLERWPELKVILMSGYTEDEAMRKGISAGPVRFLQKPFGMSALARELRSALVDVPAASAGSAES